MPVSMRLLALTLFLLCVNVTLTKCLSQRSILSCAVGIKSKTYFTPNLVYRLQLIIKETKVDRAASKIAFYLHTKENTKGQIITTNDKESLKNAFFNPNRPTRIITHGYWNSKDSIACTQPLNAFLASGDYNVIVLDWWDLQNLLFGIPKLYSSVVGYVADVSKAVTEMLNFLEDEGNNPMTTKLIGHSLGAHIMGMASYFARRKVDHIIGLDPALPSFESKGPGERLSTDDANTVEVIHTNEGSCGITEPIGHFDFYPNGGSKQPGCWFNPCAHSRSIEFYAEAINSESGFFGRKCHLPYESVKVGNCTGSIVKMGEAVKKRSASEGVFYLRTNKAYPFATGV